MKENIKCYLTELELSFVKNVIERFPNFKEHGQYSFYENKISFHFLAQLLAPENNYERFEGLLLKSALCRSSDQENRLKDLKMMPLKRARRVLNSISNIEKTFDVTVKVDFLFSCIPIDQEIKPVLDAYLITEEEIFDKSYYNNLFSKLKRAESISEIINNKEYLDIFAKYIKNNSLREVGVRYKENIQPVLAIVWMYFCFDKLNDEGSIRRKLDIYMNEHLRFCNKNSTIYYGDKYCKLAKGKNEHYLGKVLFDNRDTIKRMHVHDIVADIEEITGKDLTSDRAVEYAARNINKKFKRNFKYVNDLILFKSPYCWINEDIIAIRKIESFHARLLKLDKPLE